MIVLTLFTFDNKVVVFDSKLSEVKMLGKVHSKTNVSPFSFKESGSCICLKITNCATMLRLQHNALGSIHPDFKVSSKPLSMNEENNLFPLSCEDWRRGTCRVYKKLRHKGQKTLSRNSIPYSPLSIRPQPL